MEEIIESKEFKIQSKAKVFDISLEQQNQRPILIKPTEDKIKQPVKMYGDFTSLLVYEEVFPIVIHVIQILQSYKQKNKQGEFIDLVDEAKHKAISILTSLADGYNKFHAEDKVILYSKARSNASHIQSLMLIFCALGIVPENISKKIIKIFNEKMKIFNSLIRKMEDKA